MYYPVAPLFLNHHVIPPLIVNALLFWHAVACSKTCLNGGTVDTSSCTCNCAKGYTGEECESEAYMSLAPA